VVAIFLAKFLATPDQSVASAAAEADAGTAAAEAADLSLPGPAGRIFIGVLLGLFVGGVLFLWWNAPATPFFSVATVNSVSAWLIPVLIVGLLIFGYLRGVKVYEAVTDGAKEGFTTAMRIVPFMVAIFVAIGMFRASGAMEIMVAALSPLTERVGLPAEALAMALLRPLSGSGAFGFMSELTRQAPDSFLAALVGVIQGSTETTFYVLAVYFGSIGVFRPRHALPAALGGELAGLIGALFICHLWFS